MLISALPVPEKAPEDPCPSGTHPEIGQKISFTYNSGAFQSAASMLGIELSDIVLWPFKSRDSIS